MENRTGDAALMESKGSFVDPGRDAPTVKRDLAHALSQLSAWSTVIQPKPTKSFAIGTYFRDQSDPGDPSFIAFVDPPSDQRIDELAVEWPKDWVRRGNYGAWLAGMNLRRASEALSMGTTIEPSEVNLPVLALNGRRYAVAPLGLMVDGNVRSPRLPLYFLTHPDLDWEDPPHWFFRELGVSLEVIGLDVVVLRQIEAVLQGRGELSGLEKATPRPQQDSRGFQMADGFYGSTMPDGSLCGVLRPSDLDGMTRESFAL
jgi:hypothetical protein